jgi:hypothetical protein
LEEGFSYLSVDVSHVPAFFSKVKKLEVFKKEEKRKINKHISNLPQLENTKYSR